MLAPVHARACTEACTQFVAHFFSPRDARDRGPSCCAAFALGANGGKRCPATYGLLITADACKSAADAASKTYGGTLAYSFYPSGCYWHTINGSVYYNSNASGAANFYAQPLCAGAASTHISMGRHCACASHAWTPRRCGGDGGDVQPCRR